MNWIISTEQEDPHDSIIVKKYPHQNHNEEKRFHRAPDCFENHIQSCNPGHESQDSKNSTHSK